MKHSEVLNLKRSHLVREIVETVVLTVLIFFAIRFVIQGNLISGISMEPGLVDNQYVMVNKIAYLFHSPERGDVIVFHKPQNTSDDLIKRVIGLPGDTIKTDSTHIWINDVLLREPYIKAPPDRPLNPIADTWLPVSLLGAPGYHPQRVHRRQSRPRLLAPHQHTPY